MIEAAEAVGRFIAGRSRPDLDGDELLRFALVRAVELFGEAASKVSDQTQSAGASVPWGRIVAMRNRLIHAYFDIDLDILWNTARVEIPGLLGDLRALLASSP
jgi:uncharacterized protein with HEPN domain